MGDETEPTTSLVDTEDKTAETTTEETVEKDETTEESATEEKDEKAEDTPEPVTAEAFEMPEGFEVAEEQMTAFVELLNDPELSRAELGQKLIEMQTDMISQTEEAIAKEFQSMQEDWQETMRADKEFGGDALNANLAEMNGFLKAQGFGAEFNQAMAMTGAGNHPAIVIPLIKLAKAFGEGVPVTGAPVKAGAEKSPADTLYGDN